jgi:hypothetical protein
MRRRWPFQQPLDRGQRSKQLIRHVISVDTGLCPTYILTQPPQVTPEPSVS